MPRENTLGLRKLYQTFLFFPKLPGSDLWINGFGPKISPFDVTHFVDAVGFAAHGNDQGR